MNLQLLAGDGVTAAPQQVLRPTENLLMPAADSVENKRLQAGSGRRMKSSSYQRFRCGFRRLAECLVEIEVGRGDTLPAVELSRRQRLPGLGRCKYTAREE
jgi:hypothetical protein